MQRCKAIAIGGQRIERVLLEILVDEVYSFVALTRFYDALPQAILERIVGPVPAMGLHDQCDVFA